MGNSFLLEDSQLTKCVPGSVMFAPNNLHRDNAPDPDAG
jgi:hypothetical protein